MTSTVGFWQHPSPLSAPRIWVAVATTSACASVYRWMTLSYPCLGFCSGPGPGLSGSLGSGCDVAPDAPRGPLSAVVGISGLAWAFRVLGATRNFGGLAASVVVTRSGAGLLLH